MLRDRRIERTVGENTKVMAGPPSTITWRSRPTEREFDQRARAEMRCSVLGTNRFSEKLTPLTATSVASIDAMQ
jgi:hypothetical protein